MLYVSTCCWYLVIMRLREGVTILSNQILFNELVHFSLIPTCTCTSVDTKVNVKIKSNPI